MILTVKKEKTNKVLLNFKAIIALTKKQEKLFEAFSDAEIVSFNITFNPNVKVVEANNLNDIDMDNIKSVIITVK